MACKFKNSKLIYLSSDYIFDGESQKKYTEESEASPVNYYGQTKLEGQKIVEENLDNYIIIRPGILYGYNSEEDRETYITKVIKTLKENKKLYVDNKVIKYPTLIDDVALAIKELIEIDAKGVYHVASSEPVTRYEWAKRIAKIYNLPEKNIIAKNEGYKAKKPLNVFLDSSKVKKLGVLITNVDEGTKIAKQQQECMLRLLYSVRPGMEILKEDVSDLRINLGKKLAKEAPVKADIVVPIPETGIFPATGFAHESGIPLYHGLIKNDDIGRTLYEPSQINRSEKIKSKIVPVNSLIKDKKIVLIDEAIITGITTEIIIRMLKEAGAKEIHVRIPCPPFISACEAKQHPIGDLIARKYLSGETEEDKQKNMEEGIKKFFDVDSVKFLSLKSLLDTLKSGKYEKCTRCFLDEDSKLKLNGKMAKRAILIVLEGIGVGALPDAKKYNDEKANTLTHIAEAINGLNIPTLEKFGLGNLTNVKGVKKVEKAIANYGKMNEKSAGRESPTGHWEVTSAILEKEPRIYPDGFPKETIEEFEKRIGMKTIGNIQMTGIEVIKKFEEEHMKTKLPIVYCAQDSSCFQVAAHENIIPLEKLYKMCEMAAEFLLPKGIVARVIAKPFHGKPGTLLKSNEKRKDYTMPPPEDTILDEFKRKNIPVLSIGRINELYSGKGVTENYKTKNNKESLDLIFKSIKKFKYGLIYISLKDMDSLYGHYRDFKGFKEALEYFDKKLGELIKLLKKEDILIIASDHGLDSTIGTDHTREYIPLFAYGKNLKDNVNLETRETFADAGQTIVDYFGIGPMKNGVSFLTEISK